MLVLDDLQPEAWLDVVALVSMVVQARMRGCVVGS